MLYIYIDIYIYYKENQHQPKKQKHRSYKRVGTRYYFCAWTNQ